MEEMLKQEDVQVVDKPAQELGPEQSLYQFTLAAAMHASKYIENFKGSRKQLKQLMSNFIRYKLVSDDNIQFSYPEVKEGFDKIEQANALKFSLYIMELESQGKIKILDSSPELAAEEVSVKVEENTNV